MDLSFLNNFSFSKEFWMFVIPVALMAIDIVTGYCKAWVRHDVKSCRMREGLVKKCGEIAVLLIGKMFEVGLSLPTYLMKGVSLYIIFMELLSVFENLDALGVPIPKAIKNALHSMNKTINESEELDNKTKETIKNIKSNRRKSK